MMTAAEKTSLTPQELLMMPNSKDYELVNGHLVQRHMGSESSAIGAAILFVLANFVRPRRLGHLFDSECGYRCFADDPKKVRKPDISFIRMGRLPDERVPQGYPAIP